MSDLHKELVRIQRELRAPKRQRTARYNYRSCEDILEAVKPILGDCLLVISDEVKHVGERYYIEATAKLSLDGDDATVTALAREGEEKNGMDAAQVSGATSSYARKYALNGLFLIDDSKDSDTPAPPAQRTETTGAKEEIEPLSDEQREEIQSLGDQLPGDIQPAGAQWASEGRTSSTDDLSAAEAQKLIPYLRKKVERIEHP